MHCCCVPEFQVEGLGVLLLLRVVQSSLVTKATLGITAQSGKSYHFLYRASRLAHLRCILVKYALNLLLELELDRESRLL
jgi:hypothetical protein